MLGCLYGQAIGDALGLGTEFMNKEEVARFYPNGLKCYEQIIQDRHRSRWPIGAWTDDTDMMLCIIDAYEDGHIDSDKVADNFKHWFNNSPIGIGSHTCKVLSMVEYLEQPENCSKLIWELSRKQSAANGAIMRTSVIGLLKDNYIETTEKTCRLTHYDYRCIGSCVIVTSIIHNLVWFNKSLSYTDIIAIGEQYDERIKEWIELAYHNQRIARLNLDDSNTTGYTLHTLAAALWCFFHATDFQNGLFAVVNEGGDADTNAAVACAILGAKYGFDKIPPHYIANMHNSKQYDKIINTFIDSLIEKA